METRHFGVRVCGVLNILAGCAGGCLGLLFTLMVIGFSGNVGGVLDVRGAMVPLPLLVFSLPSPACACSSPPNALEAWR